MKYGHMRGETKDVTEEEKVTEQEEIWTGCVKWATFLTAAVTAMVQVWFRTCVWTRISASCHGTVRGSDGSVWLCCACARTRGLRGLLHTLGTLKAAGTPHLSVLSSWLLPAGIFLQPVRGWSCLMDTLLWVFMVTAQPGAFGSVKGDRKGAAWIGCPLRSSSSPPDFGTRLSPAHQMQSWLSVK